MGDSGGRSPDDPAYGGIAWSGRRNRAAEWFANGIKTGCFERPGSFIHERFMARAACCPWASGAFSELVQWEASLRSAFPDRDGLVRVRVAGDVVRVCRVVRARHVGSFMGIAPRGRTVAFPVSYRARIVGDVLGGADVYADLISLVRQLTGRRPVHTRPTCRTGPR